MDVEDLIRMVECYQGAQRRVQRNADNRAEAESQRKYFLERLRERLEGGWDCEDTVLALARQIRRVRSATEAGERAKADAKHEMSILRDVAGRVQHYPIGDLL